MGNFPNDPLCNVNILVALLQSSFPCPVQEGFLPDEVLLFYGSFVKSILLFSFYPFCCPHTLMWRTIGGGFCGQRTYIHIQCRIRQQSPQSRGLLTPSQPSVRPHPMSINHAVFSVVDEERQTHARHPQICHS